LSTWLPLSCRCCCWWCCCCRCCCRCCVGVVVGVIVGVVVGVVVGVGVGVGNPVIGFVISNEHPVDTILIFVVPLGAKFVPYPPCNDTNGTPVSNGVPAHVTPVHEYKLKGPGVPTIEFNVIVTGTDIFYFIIFFILYLHLLYQNMG
jgi:hypothetical protein